MIRAVKPVSRGAKSGARKIGGGGRLWVGSTGLGSGNDSPGPSASDPHRWKSRKYPMRSAEAGYNDPLSGPVEAFAGALLNRTT